MWRKNNRPQIEGDFLHFIYQVRFYVNIYGSVPCKGPASLFVSAEAADQVWILDFIVKVPDKGSSG